MANLLNLIGCAGVSKFENHNAKNCERYFQYGISLIALWLPIEWYFHKSLLIPELVTLLSYWIIWTILFLEFVITSSLVNDKFKYFSKNWLSLLIVIISFPPLWFHPNVILVVRIARFLIFLRILIPSYKTLADILSFNHLGSTIIVATFLTIFSGIIISAFDPNIPTPWDGLWWAWETITSVGYGDEVPTTTAGRILAIVIMVIGAALFSLLTANLSAYFIDRAQRHAKKYNRKKAFEPKNEMQEQLFEIKKQLDEIHQILKINGLEKKSELNKEEIESY